MEAKDINKKLLYFLCNQNDKRQVYHLLNDEVMLFTPGQESGDQQVEVLKGADIEQLEQKCPDEMEMMREETELVAGAGASFELEDFLIH